MVITEYVSTLSSPRKISLAFAIALSLLFSLRLFTGEFFTYSQCAPLGSSLFLLVLFTGSTVVVTIEAIRILIQRIHWSDRQHFIVVRFLWLFIFSIQMIGLSINRFFLL